MDAHDETQDSTQRRSRRAWWLFAAAALFYLTVEHRAHLAGAARYLPLLVFLACPLLHVFMHGGHGGHGRLGPRDERGGSGDAMARSDPHGR